MGKKSVNTKRILIKTLLSSGSVIALAPTSWTKPVLKSIALPAHAQTSSIFGLDAVGNVVITPNTEPDDSSKGLVAWFSFDIATISSTQIQNGASFSFVRLPKILDFEFNFLGLWDSIVHLKFKNNRIVELYAQRMLSDVNGTYDIIVQVDNPDGAIGRTIFKLKISGF